MELSSRMAFSSLLLCSIIQEYLDRRYVNDCGGNVHSIAYDPKSALYAITLTPQTKTDNDSAAVLARRD